MTKTSLPLGLRVKHQTNKRSGLVIGPAQHGIGCDLIPIALEGSTRRELWPSHLCIKKDKHHQLKANGGSFTPPKGFPLTPA